MKTIKKEKKNLYNDQQMANWEIMTLIQYLLDVGYTIDDLLFIPHISNHHETKLVHKVSSNNNQVVIYLNRYVFPYEVYSALFDDEINPENLVLQGLLKIESLLLKKRYELLFIESVGKHSDTSTNNILARKTDFFPKSPLYLSDKLTQVLRAYGYVYGSIQQVNVYQAITNNYLYDDAQILGVIEIGDYRQINIKRVTLQLFLREQYSELSFDLIERYIKKDMEQIISQNNGLLRIHITVYRHPYEPFTLRNSSYSQIFSQCLTIKA